MSLNTTPADAIGCPWCGGPTHFDQVIGKERCSAENWVCNWVAR